MGANFVTLSTLVTLLVLAGSSAALGDSPSSSSLHRGTADDDYRPFVPYDSLVRVKRAPQLVASPVEAARHAHFARRAPRHLNEHNPLRLRQVANPREAAKRWEHREVKRATASNLPAAVVCSNSVAAYGQCGGMGWTGDTCCAGNYVCTVSDAWYSQCRPGPSTSTSSTTTTTVAPTTTTTSKAVTTTSSSAAAPAATCSGSVSAWGQCGGIGWTGSTCCSTAGYTCTYGNDWYYQCLVGTPAVSTSSSSSSAVATTTTSAQPVTTSVPAIAVPSCSGNAGSYGQCGGLLWLGSTCCPSGSTCTASSLFYSQCLPGTASSSSSSSSSSTTTSNTTTTKAATTTTTTTTTSSSASKTSSTTSSAPSASSTSSAICLLNGSGSDGCTPYSVTAAGVGLPLGTTYGDAGNVNYQAIPCSQYTLGETYRKPGSDWTPRGFGVHFEALNNQPSGVWIGKSLYPFTLAATAFPAGFCVTWVQVDVSGSKSYNQHWGEGGQPPICSTNCLL